MKKFGPLNSGEATSVSDAGDATSEGVSNHAVQGRVVGIYIDPNLSCLSAPTITVTTRDQPVTLLAVATDVAGWYYPSTPIHDPTSGAVIATLKSNGIPIDDYVKVTITNAQNDDDVDVWLMLE